MPSESSPPAVAESLAEAPLPVDFETEALALARSIFEGDGALGLRQAYVDVDGDRILAAFDVPGGVPIGDEVSALVVKTRAHGFAVFRELWYVNIPPGMTREDFPADLSTYEGRRERLAVLVEHRRIAGGATRMWRAEITREVGRPALGPWVLGEGERYSGRLIGLLALVPADVPEAPSASASEEVSDVR